MKKSGFIIAALLVSLCILSGCVQPNTYNPFISKEKPSNNYYTSELSQALNTEKPVKIFMFYREFYKEFTFPKPDEEDIISFIRILGDDNFIDKPSDLPDNYIYKVYIEFNDCKYGITVFNEKYVSIYKWDGVYKEDYADISSVPLSLNIYGICRYFTEN